MSKFFKKLNLMQKITILLLAIFILMQTLLPIGVSAATDMVHLYTNSGLVGWLKWDGVTIETSDAWYDGGNTEYPAYCIYPKKKKRIKELIDKL